VFVLLHGSDGLGLLRVSLPRCLNALPLSPAPARARGWLFCFLASLHLTVTGLPSPAASCVCQHRNHLIGSLVLQRRLWISLSGGTRKPRLPKMSQPRSPPLHPPPLLLHPLLFQLRQWPGSLLLLQLSLHRRLYVVVGFRYAIIIANKTPVPVAAPVVRAPPAPAPEPIQAPAVANVQVEAFLPVWMIKSTICLSYK
jgi:hypothetical protein